MISVIGLKEAQDIVRKHHSNRDTTINILWFQNKEEMMKKIKLVNVLIGAQCPLRTTTLHTGLYGAMNDLKFLKKKLKKFITFICVPEKHQKIYQEHLNTIHEGMEVYLIS